jgi:hypothetical protein
MNTSKSDDRIFNNSYNTLEYNSQVNESEIKLANYSYIQPNQIDIDYLQLDFLKTDILDIFNTVSTAWSNYVSVQQMVEQGWYPDLKLEFTFSRGRVNATIQRI